METIENTTALTLLELYDEDIRKLASRVGKDRSVNTLIALRQGRGYVVAYLLSQLHRKDIPLRDLPPRLIYDFSHYLSAERGLRGGTVWLVCQQLKGVVTRAHQRALIAWNPFAGFHIAKHIRPREYLTEEELSRLMTHDFKKATLRFARDIFIFAAFTGLSFIDIAELRPTDIRQIGDALWIVSRRHKTKVPYQVKLLDIPLQIVRRYQQPSQERVFGRMPYRAMASRIRCVMDELGITKHITYHCARHSFAILAINKGMPIESISRILGHTNIGTTQIYAKIAMRKLDEDMSEFEKRLNIPTMR